jgi:N-acetylglucosamine-6-phosphate deacetylase
LHLKKLLSTMLIINNATLHAPDSESAAATVIIDQGRIAAIELEMPHSLPEGAEIIDAGGQSLLPGFIDLQVNGGFGLDFTADPATIWKVAAGLPQYGVTAFLPTIITAPLSVTRRAQAVIRQGPPQGFAGAAPLGLHIEGPFLHPDKKGAHNPDHLRSPALADIKHWSLEQGVRLVTLAPELPGALDLVRVLVARGVVVSAGHSTAALAAALQGFDAGIRYGTHLFNAMPPLHHREPGLAGALLADNRPVIGLIGDGIHVHPDIIRIVWQAASSRLNLVTDAMAALGMPPGAYQLGDRQVIVSETEARLESGTLAGSVLSMDQALRQLQQFAGCTLAQAAQTVTTTPAALLGLSRKGAISPGYDADLVLLDAAGRVARTIIGGKTVYQAGSE